jgi:hypothetical protein
VRLETLREPMDIVMILLVGVLVVLVVKALE